MRRSPSTGPPKNDAAPLAGGARVNDSVTHQNDTAPDMLASALAYAKRFGWLVFPVQTPVFKNGRVECSCGAGRDCPEKNIGKHPRWMRETLQHGHLDATTDPQIIQDWWTRWPNANIGIAAGVRSGLVVIDVDPRSGGEDTISELEAKYGRLPLTAQVLTGGGGTHYYLLHPGADFFVKSKDGALGPGVDVKADGGYVLAPPSMHRFGRRYQWEWSSLPEHVPVAELPGWLRSVIELQKGSRHPSMALSRSGSAASSSSSDSVALSRSGSTALSRPSDARADIPSDVLALIKRTLPAKPGTRRADAMRFARGLKFDLGYGTRSLGELRGWVNAWHEAAWPFTSRTSTADETWIDFQEFWEDVRIPLDAARVAMARALEDPLPPAALRYSDRRIQLLVALCWQLQKIVGDRPFSLSTYQAGDLLEIDNQKAYRWLGSFVREGILERVDPGKAGPAGAKGSAARWRFRGA